MRGVGVAEEAGREQLELEKLVTELALMTDTAQQHITVQRSTAEHTDTQPKASRDGGREVSGLFH